MTDTNLTEKTFNFRLVCEWERRDMDYGKCGRRIEGEEASSSDLTAREVILLDSLLREFGKDEEIDLADKISPVVKSAQSSLAKEEKKP